MKQLATCGMPQPSGSFQNSGLAIDTDFNMDLYADIDISIDIDTDIDIGIDTAAVYIYI